MTHFRTLVALTLLLPAVTSGCKLLKRKTADVDASAPIPARGTPFVLSAPHDVKEAVWLPDGKLLGTSDKELYVVTPGSPAVRRIENRADIRELHGKNGMASFLLQDDQGLVLWDATTVKPKKAYQGSMTVTALSDDGSRAAVWECQGEDDRMVCGLGILDLATGVDVATLETSMATHAPEVDLSSDGKYARIVGAEVFLAETKTSKTVLRRSPRPALAVIGRGTPRPDYVAFRGHRAILESDRGLEMIDLPSGKVLAQTPDPFPEDDTAIFGVDADGKRVGIWGGTEQLVIWDPAASPSVQRVSNVTADAACLGTGNAPKVCADRSDRAQLEVVQRYPAKGKEECRIASMGTKRPPNIEHSALCVPDGFTRGFSFAKLRTDERYFGGPYRGGLLAIDLEKGTVEGWAIRRHSIHSATSGRWSIGAFSRSIAIRRCG